MTGGAEGQAKQDVFACPKSAVESGIEAYAALQPAASDAHGHHDIAVFVIVAFGGAELAGGLRVF
jgi:hypothetical protein